MLRIFLYISIALFFASCKKSGPSSSGGSAASTPQITGVVQLARVRGATVQARALTSSGDPGRVLATATTNSRGEYTLQLPSNTNSVLITTSGGTYPDEATGSSLSAPVLTTVVNTSTTQIAPITAISSLSAERTRHLMKTNGDTLDAALNKANKEASQPFGLDQIDVTTLPAPPDELTGHNLRQVKHSFALATFSHFVKLNFPERTLDSIMNDLRDDMRDGVLDGPFAALWKQQMQGAMVEAKNNDRLGFKEYTTDVASRMGSFDPAADDSAELTPTLSTLAPNPTRQPIPVTVVFNRPASGFTASDVTLTNGSLSGFTGSGANYSFTVTASASGPVTVKINSNRATDASGNPNQASNTLNIVYDNTAPTLTLSSGNSTAIRGPATITATFSETVTGFTEDDISISNGTISGLSGTGSSYTFQVIPTNQGAVSISVPAERVEDAVGLKNTASSQLNLIFDSQAPTVSLSSTSPATTNTLIPVTVNLAEEVTGFTATDISVTNGSLSSFAGTGLTRTFVVTPMNQGAVTISIGSNAFTDLAGNQNSVSNTLSFIYDTIGPQTPLIQIESNATHTSTALVSLNLSASEGPAQMYITNIAGCASGGAWETYSASRAAWMLGQLNAPATVFAKFRDSIGNESLCVSDTILHDSEPPTSTSITINSGAPKATLTTVTLSLLATGATQMYVSSNAGCETGGTWETYSPTKPWTLSTSLGDQSVYVQYRDGASNRSACLQASIKLVPQIQITSQPTSQTASGGSATFQVGASATFEATLSYQWQESSGLGQAFTNIEGATSSSLVLTGLTLAKNGFIYRAVVSATGDADSVNSTVVDLTVRETNPPVGTISINNGAAFTTAPSPFSVTLALSATDDSELKDMYVTNTAGCSAGGTWENYSTSKVWNLAQSNAVATVYVKYRDIYNNESSCLSDTITHDNTAPAGAFIVINDGTPPATHTNTTAVTLALGASEALSKMYITNNAGCTSGGTEENFQATRNWTLLQNNATATVFAKFQDLAGNWSACVNDTIIHDTTPSQVTLTSTVSTRTNAAFTVNATFTKAVTGLETSDFTVTNAAVSALTGSGTSYSFTVTPTTQGAVSVSLGIDKTVDVAGNGNSLSNSISTVFDTEKPSISLSTTAGSNTNSTSIPLTLTFSEGVTGFDASDITVTNASKGVLTGSGSTYQMVLTALAPGEVTAVVAADSAQDAAGNNNTASNSLSVTVDTSAPTVAISSTAPANTNTSIPVTVSFSESVLGFVQGDLNVTNGSVVSFTGSGSSYSFTINPTANGTVTVLVPANSAQDAANNNNSASNSLSFNFDTTEPTVLSVTSSKANGAYTVGELIPIQVTFSKALTLSNSAQLVLETGDVDAIATYVSGSGTPTLTFNYTVVAGHETSKLDYTAPNALTLVTGTLRDIASNNANLALPNPGATNSLGANKLIAIDTTAPTMGSLTIQGGDSTALSLLDLALYAEGATEMAITESANCGGTLAWESYSTTKSAFPLSLSQRNTTATLYAKFRDQAGNESACVSDSIIHDNVAPTSTSISINNGDANTATDAVTLSLSATGASQMAITNTADCGGTLSWEAYNNTKPWTLASTSGINTVFIKYKDLAENESACISDSINVEAIPQNPTGLIATPNHSSQITLSWVNGGGTTASFQIAYQLGQTAPADCASGTIINHSTLGAATSYAITGLTTQDYAFRVCARNTSGFFSSGVTANGTTGWYQEAYIKAPNAGADDRFAETVPISGDTLVVGAPREDNSVTTITNGTFSGADTGTATDSGAAYVFRRTGSSWRNEAYLKGSNSEAGDSFGTWVAISGDTIMVGATGEDSNQNTITNGTSSSSNNGSGDSGAAYVFKRTGSTWAQEAYLKAPNNGLSDLFGFAASISGDTMVVSAHFEDNAATTITNGTFSSADSGTATDSGAAYVFKRNGSTWANEAYLKASNTRSGDYFGFGPVSISGDTLVIGSPLEDNGANTISNGAYSTNDSSAINSGAAYVFKRTGSTWANEAYLKAPNSGTSDLFAQSASISGDTILVGGQGDDNSATTITNGTFSSADSGTATDSGAAYVFKRTGSTWANEAYLKAGNSGAGDVFGLNVSVSGDTLVIGARAEDNSATTIVNGTFLGADSGTATDSGAAYVFKRTGSSWIQEAYLKAPNAGAGDLFGNRVFISGDTIAIGARFEDNSQTTIVNGVFNGADAGTATDSGAVYVFRRAEDISLTPTVASVTPSTGLAQNWNVVVYGSGFRQGALVTVGGSSCVSTTVHGPNEILCSLPAAPGGTAGPHNLVVTNPNGGGTSQLAGAITYDLTPPTLTLASLSPSSTSTNIAVNATFSKAVTGFDATDITVTNGTAGTVSGSGTSYTFTVTPSAQGPVEISVAAGAAQDIALNSSTASNTLNYTFDTVAPTLSLSSTTANPTNGSIAVTATFSETVTGFDASDLSITNGTAGAVSGSGTSYTFTVTPTAQGAVAISVAANKAQDAAGNQNTLSNTLNYTFDSVAPTLSLSSTTPNPTAGFIAVTATFSESVTGFEIGDVTVTNGMAGSLSGSGSSYTFSVSPTAQGAVTVSVAANRAQDAAGNDNTASNTLNYQFIIPPSEPSGVLGTAGNGQVSLSWVAPSSNGGALITDYAIEYSSNGGGTWVPFTDSVSASTSAIVTGLVNGTEYLFRVAAINAAGTGAFSSPSLGVTPYTTPEAPSAVAAAALDGEVALTWVVPSSNGNAISDYVVRFSSNSGSTWTTFNDTISTSTSLTVTGLSNGTSYIFQVAAVNGAGIGSYSASSIAVTPQPAFISTWKTDNTSTGSSTATQVKLPLESTGTYNFIVQWGDGQQNTITAWDDANTTHTYATAGTYTIRIHGTLTGFRFNNGGDRNKITNISQFGRLNLGNSNSYFFGARNLTITATDPLDLTGTTDLAGAFRDCVSLTTAPSMAAWDTSNVTNIFAAFHSATNFNQDISNWNTAKVEWMGYVFINSAFNQDISRWNTSNVTFMAGMFSGTPFNQNIGSWNTANVTNMAFLFSNNSAFNQDISSWNTSKIQYLTQTFMNATAFNKNIGNWNVSNVVNMYQMFLGASGFTRTNYDALLLSWSSQNVKTGVSFHAGSAKYSLSAPVIAARAALTTATGSGGKGWTITDGGGYDVTPPTITLSSLTPNPTNDPIAVTATFSEDVTGFEASDIVITNGTLVEFSGTGSVYTFALAPIAQGSVSINVDANKAQDAAGNPNTASNTLTYTFDSVAPTLELSSTSGSNTNTAIPVTATFSEAVTGFDVSDITVTNGTAGSFAGSGSNYTFVVTPSAQGPVTISVASDRAQDAAYNPNTASNTLSTTFDNIVPTVSLSSTAPANTNTSIPVTVSFSEPVLGFVQGDLNVTNGSVVSFTGSGSAYSFTINPTANGTVTVIVPANSAQDAANNNNSASNTLSFNFDTTEATVLSVNSSKANGAYTVGEVIPIQVTFSKALTLSNSAQLVLETGDVDAIATYVSGSGTTTLTFNYTVVAGHETSKLDYTATNALTLVSGSLRDIASNNANLTLPNPGATNSLGANKLITIDTTAPTSPVISINNGHTYTSNTLVDLTLSALGSPSHMYITNTAGCASGGAWEAYQTTYSAWVLGQTNTNATVHVKYKDAAGNETACVSDSIIHDSTGTYFVNGEKFSGWRAANSTYYVDGIAHPGLNSSGTGTSTANNKYYVGGALASGYLLSNIPDDKNVLLMHMDGANNSTTFVDASPSNLPITRNGNAKISTAQSKFGGASAYFDGSTSVALNDAQSSLSFDGPFTIEAWANFYDVSGNGTFIFSAGDDWGSPNYGFGLARDDGRGYHGLQFFYGVYGYNMVNILTSYIPTPSQWNHYVITRDSSSTWRIFVNGTEIEHSIREENVSFNPAYHVLANNSSSVGYLFSGFLDELRITKGVARYTSNFTPPTEAFPGTKRICYANGVDTETVSASGTGWCAPVNTYYLAGVAHPGLNSSGTGFSSTNNTYYIAGVAYPGLNSSGTGFSTTNSTYYVAGIAHPGLNSSGTGTSTANNKYYVSGALANGVVLTNIPDDKNVLLMHMEGSEGSTTFTDSSPKGFQASVTGNSQIVTTTSRFGGASAYFDGSEDFLSFSSATDFTFGAEDFTVELWFRPDSSPDDWSEKSLITTSDPIDNQGFMLGHYNRYGRFTGANGGINQWLWENVSIDPGNWHHYAASRTNGFTTIFLNGNAVGKYADTTFYNNENNLLRVGGRTIGNQYFRGWIDELRITKGFARYASSFTPPTEAFPGTKRICYANGVDTGTLNSNGTGWCAPAEKYYVAGTETSLPESGTGVWNNTYYIAGTAHPGLDLSGTGFSNTNFKCYLAGAVSPSINEVGTGICGTNFYDKGVDIGDYDPTPQANGAGTVTITLVVFMGNSLTSNYSGDENFVFMEGTSLGWEASLTTTKTVTLNTGSVSDWTSNSGTINGSAIFNGSSSNYGTVNGSATFNDSSQNSLWGGTIDGNATFNDSSTNFGMVTGNASFNDSSYNFGTVTGTPTYNGLTGWVGTLWGWFNVNTYFVLGERTTLDSTGSGTWKGILWVNGSSPYFIDGVPANGYFNNTYYIAGYPTSLPESGTGLNSVDGKYYALGSPLNGLIDGVCYKDGVDTLELSGGTGWCSGDSTYYVSLIAQPGLDPTGTGLNSIDDKVYYNGSIANGFVQPANANSTALLLHMDGTSASTTFIDSSFENHSISPNGNAQVSIAQAKFGSGSLSLDGYSSIQTSSFLWSAPITIEFWMYATNDDDDGSTHHIITTSTSQSDGNFSIMIQSGRKLAASRLGWSQIASNDNAFAINTWTHVAFVVDQSGNASIFSNGHLVANGSAGLSWGDVTSPLTIGSSFQSWDENFIGYIDEVRVTKGLALYNPLSTFMPYSSAFSTVVVGCYSSGIKTVDIFTLDGTGWCNPTYYIAGQVSSLPQSGTGLNLVDGKYYVSGGPAEGLISNGYVYVGGLLANPTNGNISICGTTAENGSQCGSFTFVNGRLAQATDGTQYGLCNGTWKNCVYDNGVAANGLVSTGYVYKNGVLAQFADGAISICGNTALSGYRCGSFFFENGALYNGLKEKTITGQTLNVGGFIDTAVADEVVSSDNFAWVGIRNSGVQKRNMVTGALVSTLSATSMTSVELLKSGDYIWAFKPTQTGAWRIHRSTDAITNFSSSSDLAVGSGLWASDGYLWLSHPSSPVLKKVDGTTGALITSVDLSATVNAPIRSIRSDSTKLALIMNTKLVFLAKTDLTVLRTVDLPSATNFKPSETWIMSQGQNAWFLSGGGSFGKTIYRYDYNSASGSYVNISLDSIEGAATDSTGFTVASTWSHRYLYHVKFDGTVDASMDINQILGIGLYPKTRLTIAERPWVAIWGSTLLIITRGNTCYSDGAVSEPVSSTGNGWCAANSTYYLNWIAQPGLNSSGTGYNTSNSTYYIAGVAMPGLNASGTGIGPDGKEYVNGVIGRIDPGGFAANVNSASQITLSWSFGGPSSATFQVAYQLGASAPASCSAGTVVSYEIVGSNTALAITELSQGTQYSFRVCARNTSGDLSAGVTASATTATICSGNCFDDSAAKTIGLAAGPSGLTIEYVKADSSCSGSSCFYLWKEKNGNRILAASGNTSDGWQKTLNRSGVGFTSNDLTDQTVISKIAGRVCPPNVFLDYNNMTATGRCLYYDDGNPLQSLNSATGTEGEDWLSDWNRASTGRGTASSWYEGNIKTCADKGMRLPTAYETTMGFSNFWLPTGDGITPTWANTNGVPSLPNKISATATAYVETSTTTYRGWIGTSRYRPSYTNDWAIRCVLP